MRAVLVAGCSIALWACGGAPQPAAVVYSDTASQQVTSDSGALVLRVYEPVSQPMGRGVNSLKLVVSAPDGSPEAGESVSMETWMPAMGHGSAVIPTVAPVGDGFEVTEISFPMAGTWQLRATLSGAVSDHATLSFDIQ